MVLVASIAQGDFACLNYFNSNINKSICVKFLAVWNTKHVSLKLFLCFALTVGF